MKSVLAFVVAAVAFAFSAGPVEAQTRTIRHPAAGSPAVVVEMPGDWTSSIDSSENLIIASANRHVAYSITVAAETRSAESVGREAMELAGGVGVTLQGAGAITPYAGSLFTGSLPMQGQTLSLRTVVVKPDAGHFVSVTLVANPAAKPVSLGEAALVLSNMKIVQ